jgi:hypothetical protein
MGRLNKEACAEEDSGRLLILYSPMLFSRNAELALILLVLNGWQEEARL